MPRSRGGLCSPTSKPGAPASVSRRHDWRRSPARTSTWRGSTPSMPRSASPCGRPRPADTVSYGTCSCPGRRVARAPRRRSTRAPYRSTVSASAVELVPSDHAPGRVVRTTEQHAADGTSERGRDRVEIQGRPTAALDHRYRDDLLPPSLDDLEERRVRGRRHDDAQHPGGRKTSSAPAIPTRTSATGEDARGCDLRTVGAGQEPGARGRSAR